MDLFQTLFLLSLAASASIILLLLKPSHKKSAKLPPGPNPLPIIGNILELGKEPHKSIAKLAEIYGPLMHLKLGKLTTIVVSSPEIARIVLQKHDQVFSNRPHPNAIQAVDHHKFSMGWMPADNQWRRLRKICKEKMFSVQKLDASQGLRREKLQDLWDYVCECSASGQPVDICKAAFTTSLNLMSNTLFSMDLSGFGADSSQELKSVVSGIMTVVGQPNVSDYFPILRMADPQGIFRESTFYFKKCFKILDDIIGQRLERRGTKSGDSTSKNDLLEALLDINQENESELCFDAIKHLLLDLFVAGTDTTSGTVEWAMTELIRNPEKMSKARNELRSVVGRNEHVQESDISRLPYLRAVVKETFRIHPTVPLSVPHKATEDIEIDKFVVPKDAQILVNVWAIGRDPSQWCDPDTFTPERFLEQEIDIRGNHFELLPFGGGRRICVGLPLAYRMVHLMLATLISSFDWKLERGLKSEELDMTERFGLSLLKAIPLKAIPTKL